MGPERELSRGPSLPTVAAPVQLTEAALEGTGTTYKYSFVVSRNGTTFTDGINTVTFPADAICETTSSYGPAYWDAPCSPVKKDVQFTVTLTQVDGVRTLTFSPDVRFVPGREVVLTTEASRLAAGAPVPTIFWNPTNSTELVDESASDASLATSLDASSGTLVRRIKHFSGYQVDIGYVDPCVANPTLPECKPAGT